MEGMRSSASQSAEVAAHKALQPAADGLAARILEKKKLPTVCPCRAAGPWHEWPHAEDRPLTKVHSHNAADNDGGHEPPGVGWKGGRGDHVRGGGGAGLW